MDRLYRRQLPPMVLERIKIGFQYLLMVIAATVAGGAVTFMLRDATFVSLFYRVYGHFSPDSAQISSIHEATLLLLRYSATDLVGALLLFLFSFSVLNYLASELLLIFEGFKFGFGACLLIRFLSSKTLKPYLSTVDSVAYLTVSMLLLIYCVFYAWQLAERSLTVRQWDPTGRPMLRSKYIGSLLLCLLRYCGWILLLNLIYGCILFLL